MCHAMKITSLHRFGNRSVPPDVPSVRTRRLALKKGPLRGIADIRSFFRTNETPVYFVSATAFNLLGIDRWVRNFKFLNYYDSFDGYHPNVFVPDGADAARVRLDRGDLQLPAGAQGGRRLRGRRGPGGKAAFLMFDEETEQLAGRARAGGGVPVGVAPPPAGLEDRDHRLGNEAGVPSVPNVMGRADDYARLMQLAHARRAGRRPRRPDAVRRLRADHVLHRRRG